MHQNTRFYIIAQSNPLVDRVELEWTHRTTAHRPRFYSATGAIFGGLVACNTATAVCHNVVIHHQYVNCPLIILSLSITITPLCFHTSLWCVSHSPISHLQVPLDWRHCLPWWPPHTPGLETPLAPVTRHTLQGQKKKKRSTITPRCSSSTTIGIDLRRAVMVISEPF